MKITLSCGHTVECENFDDVICEKCNKKEELNKVIGEKENNKPEYMKIMDDITTELKKVNNSISLKINQNKSGGIDYKFSEPVKMFMKIFHSEKKYDYTIENINKQPISELKIILDNIKSKSELAKKFRETYGRSAVRFIVDEIFYNLQYDGKNFTNVECTLSKQYKYVGLVMGIIGTLFGVVFGI